MTIEDSKHAKQTHSQFIQKFIDQVAPLVLDAFVMHLWLQPLLSNILIKTPLHSGTGFTLSMVLLCSILTFTLNMSIYPHLTDIHLRTGVGDSPLFRSIWVFICAAAARRYTGGGAMPFTIVTFIPLLYVRVPHLIHVISCVYGLLFFTVSITRNAFMLFRDKITRPDSYNPSGDDFYVLGFYWFVFIFTSIFHPIFMSSQMYTTDRHQNMNRSNIAFVWRFAGTRIAIFRSIVVLLTALLYDRNSAMYLQKNRDNMEFIETLFLYMTITTFTAWVHCQHVNPNKLSNILTSSVAAASCGMIVDNIEQAAFLCALTPAAIAFDTYSARIKDMGKSHKE